MNTTGMDVYTGTTQGFHKYIGPSIKNAVNSLARKARTARKGVCEGCEDQHELQSAHVRGRERRAIIEQILSRHAVWDLGVVVPEILKAHLPIKETFKFLCYDCHAVYDGRSKKGDQQ